MECFWLAFCFSFFFLFPCFSCSVLSFPFVLVFFFCLLCVFLLLFSVPFFLCLFALRWFSSPVTAADLRGLARIGRRSLCTWAHYT